jgi:hypothetical protein
MPLRRRTFSFLLDLRDYLNSWADPATGASIAFTNLVVRKSPQALKGKADAERAYPEWIQPARALSRAMVVLLHLAVIITLSIAALAAYIYFGSAKIANLAEINSQFKLLDEEILREEVAVNRPPNTSVLPYCTDVESVPNPANATETVQRFRSVAHRISAPSSTICCKNRRSPTRICLPGTRLTIARCPQCSTL